MKEETLNLKDALKILTKRWKSIFVITVLCTLIGFLFSFFVITPVYQAETQLLVNPKDSGKQIDVTQLQGNIDMINTYSVILKSPAILDKVIEELKLPLNTEELRKQMNITSEENSQVFSLTIENSDPEKAVSISNSISKTFQSEIKSIMKVDNVTILAKAELPEKPIKPNKLFNTGISLIIGLFLGIGLAILLEYLDNTIKDSKELNTLLSLPVLGSVPVLPAPNLTNRPGISMKSMRG